MGYNRTFSVEIELYPVNVVESRSICWSERENASYTEAMLNKANAMQVEKAL